MLLKLLLLSKEMELQKVVLNKNVSTRVTNIIIILILSKTVAKKVTDCFLYI